LFHLLQVGLLVNTSSKRSPFRSQCPINSPVIHLCWLLFSFNSFLVGYPLHVKESVVDSHNDTLVIIAGQYYSNQIKTTKSLNLKQHKQNQMQQLGKYMHKCNNSETFTLLLCLNFQFVTVNFVTLTNHGKLAGAYKQ
jgi:hypothetical protein